MKILIKYKYLIFPVNKYASEKKLTLSDSLNGEYKLKIRLDNLSPDFDAYIDVSRFIGREISVSAEPNMEVRFKESDTMDIPGIYTEDYRPQIHFTTRNGWLNDPNGLIFIDGKYHMFYQHNPCEPRWGNMHWGHAISRDMIHWEETDIALFPDKSGTMFSGSAIADENNLLGLQNGDTPTVLLYYTATEPFSQYLAYSTDGLKTIHKTNAPVIPHIVGGNRDPKVVFCEEWDAYVLVLYMSGETYAFFRSEDLTHWDKVQEITVTGENECPDLFPLTTDDGKRKWVFIGAHDRYVVGDMREDGFHPTQEAQSLHYGKSAYAGQTFSCLPNGRVVRIDWDRWGISTPRFNGQMGFPTDLTLKHTDDVYYLCALPIKEIESIYDSEIITENVKLQANIKNGIPLSMSPYMIKIKADLPSETRLTLELFGRKIICDTEKNSITLSKNTAPLSFTPGKIDLVIISDRCSLEIYSDGGKFYMSTVDENTCCDYNLPYLETVASSDCEIQRIELHSLKSIWGK